MIYRDGMACGYVNRAGFGYTVQQGIAFGYIALDNGETPSQVVKQARFEIDVEGDMVPAAPHLKPIYPGKAYLTC